MARPKRPERVPVSESKPGASGVTLGDLFARAGLATPSHTPVPPAQAATPSAPSAPGITNGVSAGGGDTDLSAAGKLVVRRVRKGRGGHTATLIEGLDPLVHDLPGLAREFKRTLGCGATVEEPDIILLGDVGARVVTWLEARGARRVVRGS